MVANVLWFGGVVYGIGRVRTNANEDWFTLAGDEDICLFVDGDVEPSKNGNGAIITDLTDAHDRLKEVRKGISG